MMRNRNKTDKTMTDVKDPRDFVNYFLEQEDGAEQFFTQEDKLYFITKTFDDRAKVTEINLYGPIEDNSEFLKLEGQFQSNNETGEEQ